MKLLEKIRWKVEGWPGRNRAKIRLMQGTVLRKIELTYCWRLRRWR